ncbi:MAG TPA: tetratricopeptide repeat protein [Anaerolineae bacterium]|nr:tetratricopeptide repeat protein [Anaerolineae bacterium]HQK15660.1 tetratricopeptide repeat protein [Anaerolineae bacterium]
MFQQKGFHGTPAAQLRELLTQLERHIGKLEHDSREEVCKIPSLFDEAATLIEELERIGTPIAGEKTRFETAAATFRRKARTFLRKAGGTKAVAALRDAHHPDPSRWWWFIDQWLAEQNKLRLRRQMNFLMIGAALLAVLAGVYMLFLRPDAATRERLHHQQRAENFAQNGDYAAALEEVNAALRVAPDNAGVLTLKGVIEAQLGMEAEAATTFAAAEAAAASREQFLLLRAQIYLTLGMPEAALPDAEAAVAINPTSARAHLYLGQANADLGNLPEAQAQFEEAARLADEADDAETAAIARVQMVYLYQQMFVPTLDDATPTP